MVAQNAIAYRQRMPAKPAKRFRKPQHRLSIVGMNLRRLRTKHEVTQEQLAERSGLSITGIALIETGERDPQFETIQALASALGEPVEELVSTHRHEVGEATARSLEAFLHTPWAKDVTEHEKHLLRSAAVPWGPLDAVGWHHILLAIRSLPGDTRHP